MSPDPKDLSSIKVLVLEDHVDITDLLSFLLKERGYSVRHLPLRDENAVSIVAEFEPNVIILDYLMPGMSAETFMTRIHTRHPQIHFVLVTARLDKAAVLAKTAAVPMLTKPFDPETLYEIIERITGSGEHVAV
jgi:two-component system OmpR family response regulator